MTKKKIYKEDVIEALETEPLGWEGWAQTTFWDTCHLPAREIDDCTVCAIGSVFRRFSQLSTYEIRDEAASQVANSCTPKLFNTHDDFALPKNWLSAISFVWESFPVLNEDISVEEARTLMIDWVEKFVPEDEVLFSIPKGRRGYGF